MGREASGYLAGGGGQLRTPRALSLGITAPLGIGGDLTSGYGCQGGSPALAWHPLLTVVYRPVGHGSGTSGERR